MDDDKLIGEIESLYKMHFEKSLKYKAMLDAYHGTSVKTVIPIPTNGSVIVTASNAGKPTSDFGPGKGTFEEKIINIFSDGRPRTVRELMMTYNKETGNELSIKEMSSKLSGRVKYKRIGSIEISQYPRKIRAWWGLEAWKEQNGKKFGQEFQARIKSANEVILELFNGEDTED